MNHIELRPMQASDWDDVRNIYHEGIQSKNATFETSAGTWEKWHDGHLTEPRMVALDDEEIIGWAALSPVSDRCVYGGVAEVSVYLRSSAQGRGIGKRLLDTIVKMSEKQGIWTLQAGIFPENKASVKLHEKCGFRIVGVREKLGKLDDVWRDVLLMERRSRSAGN